MKASFRHLDALCYTLKQKHAALKRSIKFDDDAQDLVADFKLTPDGQWKRVTAIEAKQARSSNPAAVPTVGPSLVSAANISDLLSDSAGQTPAS